MAEAKVDGVYRHPEGEFRVICNAKGWNSKENYVVCKNIRTGANWLVREDEFFATEERDGKRVRVFEYREG